jgi:SAM-dependent methyltransferase
MADRNELETAVAEHYSAADLLSRIDAGLRQAGRDPENLALEDLAPVDEFHIGGRPATQYAVAKMPLDAAHHVLDVGCGLGGAARYVAQEIGCAVSGIDLTPDYVDVANALTARVGLGDRMRFATASALDMPFADGAFDAAFTFHVAMNIAHRDGLYREIARVLKPGAAFCVYDVMRTGPGEVVYPTPWAETGATSHLASAEETESYLRAAGFDIRETESRRDFALEFFRQRLAGAADGPPPLGIHLLMGATWREKFKNTLENIEAGRIAPVQIIATRLPD